MTLPNGPPTPIGEGGPTPPLVSRGSEEEWKMKIPQEGPLPRRGGGVQHLLPLRGEGSAYPKFGVEAPLTQGGDEEPSPTQWEREEPPLTRGGGEEPPPTRGG